MSNIEFGIGLRRLDSVTEDAKIAEDLGYSYLCTGEHVFFYGPINNGLIALAAAAGATSRIKLISTITLAPLYPPALLAKQVASLATISGARFSLGIGVGGEFAKEFEACGIPINERGARTNEALEVMLRLWTEDNVEFTGRFITLPGVTLDPKPGNVPIWVSGRSDAALKRCATYGSGWLPYMYTPDMLRDSLTKIANYRDPTRPAIDPGLFIFCAVHPDGEKALQMASDRLSKQYNQDFSQLVGKYAIAGNPDDCIARIQEYREAGATTILFNSACPQHHVEENERLLASEVLSAFDH